MPKDSKKETKLLEGVQPETLSLGMALGLIRLGDDGIHEMTPIGDAWLRQWCEQKLAELDS